MALDLVVFESNKAYVINEFREGRFDYLELASDVAETKFFQFLFGQGLVDRLVRDYPSPRQRHHVPLWMYLSSQLSLRLHGSHSFHSYPLIVRAGGLIDALGPELARREVDPATGDMGIWCAGFNQRNLGPRATPCDQDYLRKLAKQTESQKLEDWYNRHVAALYGEMGAYEEEGIFVGDGSYLFVPDNENYEGSKRLLFDEHNHPVIPIRKNMDILQDVRGIVTLDVPWEEYRPAHRAPLKPSRTKHPTAQKRERKRQKTLAKKQAEARRRDPPDPSEVLQRTLITKVPELTSWSDCPVPLTGVYSKDCYADGHQKDWLLVTTNPRWTARAVCDYYGLRTDIEERHRQVKCFWDLTRFHSTAWNLIVSQTVFVALTYSLLQLYLLQHGHEELNRRTIETTRRLLPDGDRVIIYCQQYFAFFTLLEHTELTLSLQEKARRKARAKIRRLQQEPPPS